MSYRHHHSLSRVGLEAIREAERRRGIGARSACKHLAIVVLNIWKGNVGGPVIAKHIGKGLLSGC